ncbi:hypothetical protein RZN25_17275 [Bacillaceae bacterium S4-13-56]
MEKSLRRWGSKSWQGLREEGSWNEFFGWIQNYKPFIQAHDNKVASEGWLTRHLGWKTKRIHHTLSEYERRYLYYLEWLDEVGDIREHYPLLPQS